MDDLGCRIPPLFHNCSTAPHRGYGGSKAQEFQSSQADTDRQDLGMAWPTKPVKLRKSSQSNIKSDQFGRNSRPFLGDLAGCMMNYLWKMMDFPHANHGAGRFTYKTDWFCESKWTGKYIRAPIWAEKIHFSWRILMNFQWFDGRMAGR